jgi:molybdopterin converting factor small subunit
VNPPITVNLELLSWICETLDGRDSPGSSVSKREVETGETVAGLLGNLAAENPRFGRSVFDIPLRQINENVCVLLNGNLLDLAGGLETTLNDGDSLVLVPFLQGG